MPDPKSVFIGSSSSAKRQLEAVTLVLKDKGVEERAWISDETFLTGMTLIESIEKQSTSVDAAIIILTPDDKMLQRDQEKYLARDNVVFEVGYFTGSLGRKRVLLLVQEDTTIPTDLGGIKFIQIPMIDGSETDCDYAERVLSKPISEWLSKLRPSFGIRDDLNRMARFCRDSDAGVALSSALRNGVGAKVTKKNKNALQDLLNERCIRSGETVLYTPKRVVLTKYIDLSLIHHDEECFYFLVEALAHSTLQAIEEWNIMPTKLAIMGKPCLSTFSDRKPEETQGIHLLEEVADLLGYPVVYVHAPTSGRASVEGVLTDNDVILIIHDVILTADKVTRCAAALRSRTHSEAVKYISTLVWYSLHGSDHTASLQENDLAWKISCDISES